MAGCTTGKRRYRDRITAELARAKIARVDDPRRETAPVRVYKCHLCHGWHLTSQPPRHRAPKGTP